MQVMQVKAIYLHRALYSSYEMYENNARNTNKKYIASMDVLRSCFKRHTDRQALLICWLTTLVVR